MPFIATAISIATTSQTNPTPVRLLSATPTRSPARTSVIAFLVQSSATVRPTVLVDGTKPIVLRRRPLVYHSNLVVNMVDSAFHAIGFAIRIPTATMAKTRRTATLSAPECPPHSPNVRLSTFAARRRTIVFRGGLFATAFLTAIVERIKNCVPNSMLPSLL